jgi:hypothetical protein
MKVATITPAILVSVQMAKKNLQAEYNYHIDRSNYLNSGGNAPMRSTIASKVEIKLARFWRFISSSPRFNRQDALGHFSAISLVDNPSNVIPSLKDYWSPRRSSQSE